MPAPEKTKCEWCEEMATSDHDSYDCGATMHNKWKKAAEALGVMEVDRDLQRRFLSELKACMESLREDWEHSKQMLNECIKDLRSDAARAGSATNRLALAARRFQQSIQTLEYVRSVSRSRAYEDAANTKDEAESDLEEALRVYEGGR